MKAKALKALLEGCDDNLNILIGDAASSFIQITGGGEQMNDAIVLWCRQEFPDEWFDPQTGEERRWIHGKAVRPDRDEVEDELYIGDDENETLVICKDGEAVRKDNGQVVLTYPKLDELTDDVIESMDEALGRRISDSGFVGFDDVAVFLGMDAREKLAPATNLYEVRSLSTRQDVGCEAMDAETLGIRLPELIEKNGSVIVLQHE